MGLCPFPRHFFRRLAAVLAALLLVGFLLPGKLVIPVQGAGVRDWNAKTFWHAPWGASGVHKGIDIFAPQGRPVLAASPGITLYHGAFGIGGNVVLILGPKWRLHYYAHLAEPSGPVPFFAGRGDPIAAVGTSGNAAGKPPHLHYSVISLLPLPWRYSSAPQGWKQMFFLNPDTLLREDALTGPQSP